MRGRSLALGAAVCVTLGAPLCASAATITWTGGGTDDKWSTAANWGTTAPAPDDALIFAGLVRPTPANDFAAGLNFSGITFNAGTAAFTLGGNPINLGGANVGVTVGNTGGMGITNGVTNNSSNRQTINFGLTLNAGNHVFNGGAGGLTLAGGVVRNAASPGSIALFTPGAGGITLAGATLQNGILGGWALSGSNWATLNASNQVVAYSAYTDVAPAGTIANDRTSNVRVNTFGGNITMAAAGTTDVNTIQYNGAAGANQTIDPGAGNVLRLGASGGIMRTGSATNAVVIGAANNSGVLTAGGADNTAGEIVLATNTAANTNNTITINSTVADNGSGAVRVVKTGQSAANLNGTNTYTGGTYISEGRLQAGNVNALGTGPITITGLGQAFLPGGTMTNNWFISGIGTAEAGGHGAIRLSNGSVLSGTVTLIGNARIATRGNGAGGTVNGNIVGPYALELGGYDNDAGDITTIGGAGNAWTGGTTISQQIILRLGASEVIPNGTAAGNVTLNVSTDLDRSAILDLNGFNETINGLSRTGSTAPSAAGVDRAAIRNNGSAPAVLTIGDNNAGGSYTGIIQDNGGTGSTLAITKIGGGVQAFGGTNLTYTGDTNVNGGTLAINGLLTASVVNVNSIAAGATLGGSGTIAGNVTLAADTGANKARINPGAAGAGSSGTLTLNTLAVNGGDLQFDLVAPGSSDMINATGLVNFNAPSTISPVGGTTGSYTLLTSTSPIVYAAGAVPTLSSPGGTGNTRPATYALDTLTNPNAILLNVTGGAGALTWSGSINANWNLVGDLNWKNGVTPDKFYNQDSVTFDDSSTNPADVQLVGTLVPGALVVNAARNYTFAGGGISGATGLTKNGAGTLVIANTGINDFTGPIVIGGGTLQVGNGGTAGGLPSTPMTNNAALVFNRSDTVTYGGAISGAGTLEQRGPGLLILSGASTYTGATTVTAGTLRPTTAAGIGAAAATVTVAPGATFDVNALNLQGHVFTVSGTGAGGVGALINGSTVDQINATRQVVMAGDTTFGATGRWDIRGALDTAYLKTNGNAYKLTKVGTGQVSLVGVDVDPALGDIDIKDGIFGIETTTNRMGDPTKTVTISPTATLKFYGLGTAMEKVAVSNGGRFWTENGNGNTFIGPVTLNATSTFENTGGTTTTFNGPIGGVGGVTKVNAGTTVFGNTNTYTGINTINGGILSVTSLANGGQPSGLGQSSAAAANLVLNGGTLGFSGTAAASTDRQFTLAGNGGGLDASGASGAPVTFASTAPIVVSGAGPVTLTLAGSNTDENVLAAKVVNGAGATAVTKNGAGTWTLTGANTYTGATTVNAGILRVKSLANGGIASGVGQSAATAANLVVANGGTLSYTGTTPASTDRQFTLAGTGGSLDASGAAGAPVVFSSTAAVVTNAGTPAATLTLTGSNTDANVFAGQLVDGAGGQQTMLVKDGLGTWTLSGASTHTGSTTVSAGTLRVTGSVATSDVNVNFGGTLDVAATQTMKTLQVQSGGLAVVSGAARKVLVVGDHSRSTPLQVFGGRLDLTTNAVIVHHDGNSGDQPLIDLRTQIIAGYNASQPGMGDGKWDGNGIVTSSAGSNGAVGYAKASELTSGTFFGQTVDASVVARYTLAGDANLDGAVDFLDLAKLAQSYNSTVSTSTESWWTHGDFNYDGNVDFLDLAKLAQNYNSALPTSPIAGAPADFQGDLARAFAAVPEPGAAGLLGLCAATLMTRRRRRLQ